MEENETKINQIYFEILCNIIRKQNITLLEKISEKECIPIDKLLSKYIMSKAKIRNILNEDLVNK
tara:strand:- start:26723 stop:26917 length:195 start_codon:yes stop_codon:yes gene_type:complete